MPFALTHCVRWIYQAGPKRTPFLANIPRGETKPCGVVESHWNEVRPIRQDQLATRLRLGSGSLSPKGLVSDSLEVMVGTVFGTLWSVILVPFRLRIGAVELFGRLVALVLGFILMVLGVAVCAGPLIIVGIPLFVVGLIITMRALD